MIKAKETLTSEILSEAVPSRVTAENSETASYTTAPDAELPFVYAEVAQPELKEHDTSLVRRLGNAPEPPVVAGPLTSGPQLSFLEFLCDPDCQKYCRFVLGGEDTAAGLMMLELLKGTDFHYFGLRVGKLNAEKSATKAALKRFAQRAYLGDPHKRGIIFWRDVSKLIWQTYEYLMSQRQLAERISQKNIKRNEGLIAAREKRANYMRAYRARESVFHNKKEESEQDS